MMRSLLMAFLPVCDEHGDLHGIIALRDLHRVLRPGHPTTAQSILAGRGTACDDRGERPRRPRLGLGGRATDVAAAGAGRAPSGRRLPLHRPGQPPKPHPPGTPVAPHAHRTVTRSPRPRRGGRCVNLYPAHSFDASSRGHTGPAERSAVPRRCAPRRMLWPTPGQASRSTALLGPGPKAGREPVGPSRVDPVTPAEQVHQRRHQGEPHHEGIDEDRDGKADADLGHDALAAEPE